MKGKDTSKKIDGFDAILEIKGKQYPVKEGQIIRVDHIDQKEDSEFNDARVLFYKKGNDEVFFGKPFLDNVKIKATVKQELKDKKVKVVRYKPKSGIRKTRGHRQKYTFLKIDRVEYS